jgi:hypothetical protein
MLAPFQLVRPPRRTLLSRRSRGASERRHYFRHNARPLKIDVEGQRYETLDWSLGGFSISNFHRPIAAGDRLRGKLGPVGGAKSGHFIAEITRVSPDGKIGLRWTEITSTSFFALSRFGPIGDETQRAEVTTQVV